MMVPSFGRSGAVDLKLEDDQEMDPVTGDIGLHAAPIVVKDTIIIGAAHTEGSRPVSRRNDKGYVRGYDVRTGKRQWIFHTIPRPGESGYDTWQQGSEEYTGNTGVWAQMSADEELGIVYLPVEMPTGDYYGGHRPGAGLFGESLVALDVKTGKRKWHFQFIKHGIWDWDLPCAPILADVTIDGKLRKIVMQPSKQGWLYVFDRVTGEPIWPFEERKVEASDVPGEIAHPTQLFVTKPAPFERQGVSPDDLIDFTPALKAEGLKLASRFKLGPLFTPPVVSKWEGPLATLMLPNVTGGANWQGGSFDPETEPLLHLHEHRYLGPRAGARAARCPTCASSAARRRIPRTRRRRPVPLTVQGIPLVKPPYGRITAHRSQDGRDGLADRARRDARQHPQPRGAQGRDDSAYRPAGPHRDAGDQDAGHRRRRRRVHAARRAPRRDAAGLRQGQRQGDGRGVHAGAADGLADDLHAQRPAVHRAGDQRAPNLPGELIAFRLPES